MKSPWKDLLTQFKEEVDNKAKEIDPENEENWFSLTLGWAIAKGLSPDDATEFAIYVRHKTDMA